MAAGIGTGGWRAVVCPPAASAGLGSAKTG